jgi:endonuclease-3
MPRPKLPPAKQRVPLLMARLADAYPDPGTALNFATPFQLLVATILSAQCTDARVNLVTPALFARFPTPEAMAAATVPQIIPFVKSTGFFRNKAKSLRGMGQAIVERHGGVVPETMEELVELPGVGRKTANVVLGNAFGKNVGVTVDTHVTRVANRLALTDHLVDAVKIEQDLIPIVPQEEWTIWSHLLIHHGRAICQARKPKCETCPLLPYCPAGQKFAKAEMKK